MRAVAVVLLALVAVAAAQTPQCASLPNGGRPQCKWQCDDPSCPAVCHPVCERPKCQMQCEEVSCAKCTIHCQKPVCTIRCPKVACEMSGCPQCESVCKPAQCHTTCVAPKPNCAPVCEQLSCQNKCVKPTNCAKPKCELQCEKSACEAATPQCCPCTAAATTQAIAIAPLCATPAQCPSFLEVFHTLQHKAQAGEQGCCPCH